MFEILSSLWAMLSSEENRLIAMFISSFTSATVLPGNSELMFSAIASRITVENSLFSTAMCWLWLVATVGNTLGGLTTYAMALLLPKPLENAQPSRRMQWVLKQSHKYGVWALLLSGLPLVGDLLCGVAGWLRFNPWHSALVLFIGKGVRYALLLIPIYGLLNY